MQKVRLLLRHLQRIKCCFSTLIFNFLPSSALWFFTSYIFNISEFVITLISSLTPKHCVISPNPHTFIWFPIPLLFPTYPHSPHQVHLNVSLFLHLFNANRAVSRVTLISIDLGNFTHNLLSVTLNH